MKIGVLSDTHGNVRRTRTAIALLRSHNIERIIFCGDAGSEAILDELVAGFCANDIPVHAVLGNVDLWDADIVQYPAETGLDMMGHEGELEWNGKRIAILHGHEGLRLQAAVQSGAYDYIFTGHTHEADDRMVGNTRLINPGAVHRSAAPSIAVLDLETGELEHLLLNSQVHD